MVELFGKVIRRRQEADKAKKVDEKVETGTVLATLITIHRYRLSSYICVLCP